MAVTILEDVLEHLDKHRVVLCRRCGYCVPPLSIHRHLKVQHSSLDVSIRQRIVHAATALPDLATDPTEVVYPQPEDEPVDGIPVWRDGLECHSEDVAGRQCGYICRDVKTMQDHCRNLHAWVNTQRRGGNSRAKRVHTPNALWRRHVSCQVFFRQPKWHRFFKIACPPAGHDSGVGSDPGSGSDDDRPSEGFFNRMRATQLAARAEEEAAADIVDGFDAHRSSVVPWIRDTGIGPHIEGLSKAKIADSFALPSPEENSLLCNIIDATETLLRQAHARCQDGPGGLLTYASRLALNSFGQRDDPHGSRLKAFGPFKEAATLGKYFRTWKGLLCFVERVAFERDHFVQDGPPDVASPRPEDVVVLSEDQRTAWEAVRALAMPPSDDPTGPPEDGPRLVSAILAFSELLLCCSLGAGKFASPLVSYCAMLTIQPSSGAWKPAGDFNSHLSGLIWVSQLLVFHIVCLQHLSGDPEVSQTTDISPRIESLASRYLHPGKETPMAEILRWRLLLFHVSKTTVQNRQACWDEQGEVLTYDGVSVGIGQISQLIASEYQQCRRILYEDLMFNTTGFRHMHARDLDDVLSNDAVGWSFLFQRGNEKSLKGAEDVLLNAIQESPALRRRFVSDPGDDPAHARWRDGALSVFEVAVQHFLSALFVLVHITSGQPLRGPEIVSLTWKNTQRSRHIMLRDGRVMIHTQYDKTQQQRGMYKDNVRFLSQAVGDLLLDYLVYVQPLRDVFRAQDHPTERRPGFLWEKHGQVWSETTLSTHLQRACDQARIPRLGLRTWRQMTVAIVKTKFPMHLAIFDAAGADDDDAEEMDADVRAMTLQRNHSVMTANRAYANSHSISPFANVWDGLLKNGLRASQLWQTFLAVDDHTKAPKRKAGFDPSPIVKRIAAGQHVPRVPWSSPQLLQAARDLFRDPAMEWRSPDQERALVAIMTWQAQVIAVLPTGAGKSLLFMLPAMVPQATTTILVLPLLALRLDMLRRLRTLRIAHAVWKPGFRGDGGLVIVSVEAAGRAEFLDYVQRLHSLQRLDRIVFDECHLTVTAAHYREAMTNMGELRALSVQVVYLTATLPPSFMAEFEERNYLARPTVIRASSNRPNIHYAVHEFDPDEGILEATRYLVEGGVDKFEAADKIIVYVRSIAEAETLSRHLGCDHYTSQTGTEREKKAVLERWCSEAGAPAIVATSALAEGFDYPRVRVAIHAGPPSSLVTFAQETGRLGRDGREAYSIVLRSSARPPSAPAIDLTASTNSIYDRAQRVEHERCAVEDYLRAERCRRTVLTQFLDAPATWRRCSTGDRLCDVCPARDDASPAPDHEPSAVDVPPPVDVRAGLVQMQQSRLRDQCEIARFRLDLAAHRGSCMLCRLGPDPWDHALDRCRSRGSFFTAKKGALERARERGRKWMAPYTACFHCYAPQAVCLRTLPGSDVQVCEFKDLVLPLCYAIFHSPNGALWLHTHFQRTFANLGAYFDWLGESTDIAGEAAVQAARVAATRLREFSDAEPAPA